MKVALVHDYLREFGGAERVLRVLADIYPDAPIYTAFRVSGSTADGEFSDREIKESVLAPILKIGNLYSPLRFLTPLIWGSMDLSKYDLVITSCSWYITRGFQVNPKTKVIAYCHTPPRWLYGYETSVGFKKYWPVRVYAFVVGHFLRMYDYATAQEPRRNFKIQNPKSKITAGVDCFVANSRNVQARIKKFYRRDSVVVCPPVDTEHIKHQTSNIKQKENYFLIVSRLVGAKGLEEAAKAFCPKDDAPLAGRKLPYKLKIVGESHGFSDVEKRLKKLSGNNVELLGRLDDVSLHHTYARAKGFIALAKDEDFGITPVEAMAAGTPVIAYNGGGFKESVINGVTGILIDDTDERTIRDAVGRFNKIKWDRKKILKQAQKFSKERFVKKIKLLVDRMHQKGFENLD